jgi:hypothetical protein
MIRPPHARRFLAAAMAAAMATALATALATTLAGPAAAASERTPVAPVAPIPPDVAADIQRIQRDVERSMRDHARAVEDAMPFRWNMLAQAEDLDIDLDFDSPSYAFIAREFGSTREIVKNAPYAAEAVNEVIQTLGDGNRIVRRSSTLVARDGYGRTRQEKKGGTAYLFDPIDNKSYALNPERKTAARIPRAPSMLAPLAPVPPTPALPALAPPAPPAPPGVTPPPAMAPRASVSERVIVRRTPDGKDLEVTPGRVVVKRSGSEGKDVEDVRSEVVRVGRDAHAMHDITPLPPLALPLLPRGKGETKVLGSREFDGVKADGTMTTHTIPAGEIGNERPILITSERWFSPELHVVVYAKNSDPRNGDTIYRLANLKRGEPPADLFKVPSDYKLRKP